MYATVRRYEGNAELADQLKAREGEVKDIVSNISGFVAYYLIRSGNDTVSVSVYQDESGAQQSNDAARKWLGENLPDVAPSPPQISAGDVIVTGTHARRYLVEDDWVSPGAHIAALGADLAGEQEIDPKTLLRGRVIVDDIRQCREDGEIHVALREGVIAETDVAGEIGKVICGELEGRQSDDQVTVFDSTGIALQDSATVPLEYERAVAAGVGIEKKMIST